MAHHQKLLALCLLLTYAVAAATSLAEAEPPASMEAESPAEEEAEMRRSHHRSTLDRSVAGGGVIIGGLATMFLVAVFCYIRATRRNKVRNYNDNESLASKV